MTDPPAIRVAPVTRELTAQVRALRVAPEQYSFVGDIAFNLVDAERDPRSDAMAILDGDGVIGFYRLDYAPTIVAWQPIAASVGLRSFLIDRRCQGRGYGTLAIAACCDDLRRRHPERKLLALNVNCINRSAIRAYRKAGFVDTGELYFGGRAGPQHLMLRSLEESRLG
ncbi:GNAT family N-acetyltransferase [Luteimonas sp. SX5]|uniref:GNAT family N-acetyltransferase n=1 Tax=Luteimonas galliterrae TaxID=2940486 RepID=A0ABT0MM05_9GAMM|nr:GNAT family N-acetyltransferase [Luteimonas galliterrae]MCL1635916.1 GNAT family N-acetyltransferase [Luteimonas galliterrae]